MATKKQKKNNQNTGCSKCPCSRYPIAKRIKNEEGKVITICLWRDPVNDVPPRLDE